MALEIENKSYMSDILNICTCKNHLRKRQMSIDVSLFGNCLMYQAIILQLRGDNIRKVVWCYSLSFWNL